MTEQSPLQVPTAKRAVGLFRVLIILSLTILAVYICSLLVLPFLPALAWALALTLLFLPVHKQIEHSVRGQNVAAAVSVVLIAVVVVVLAEEVLGGRRRLSRFQDPRMEGEE